MQHRFVRRLALEIMTEVTQVARKEGVRLEKVSGTLDLSWIALDEAERAAAGSPSLVAKHGLLLAVGFRYRRMKSSMLSAIERGRTPAVDFLNGEVVDRARDAQDRRPGERARARHGLVDRERQEQARHRAPEGALRSDRPSRRLTRLRDRAVVQPGQRGLV